MAKPHALSAQEAVERGREYVHAYMERVKASGLEGEAAPALFRGQPYDVHCLALENGGLVLFLRSDAKGGFAHVPRAELASQAYDFSVHLTKAEARDAKGRGAADAERDCSLAGAIAGLDAAKREAKSLRESAEALLKTNPWLDEYAESSIGSSERLAAALAEHADALRREMDAMAASHRSAMADLASGMAQVEPSPAKDDAAVTQLKSRVNELRDEHEERWKKAERDLAVLSDVARRVDTFGDDLEALNLKLSKEMDESGGSKKMKENLKVLTGMIEALEAEVNVLRDDVKVSQEIKDTLFRDSKRLHNMHERLNAMELQHDGDDDAKVAELKKRIDAMERRMTSEISIAVSEALAASGVGQPAPKPKPAPRKR